MLKHGVIRTQTAWEEYYKEMCYLSPKLFITTLDDAFRNVDSTKKGINSDRISVSHLLFADDNILQNRDPIELKDKVNELKRTTKENKSDSKHTEVY